MKKENENPILKEELNSKSHIQYRFNHLNEVENKEGISQCDIQVKLEDVPYEPFEDEQQFCPDENCISSEYVDEDCTCIRPESKVLVCSTIKDLENSHLKEPLSPKVRCDVCEKRYSSLSVLKTHKIRHRKKEDLPFQCLLCHYRTASKIDLQRHNDQHKGSDRPLYNCKLCIKIFKRSSSLTEHIRIAHTKDVTYKCANCEFTTMRRASMRSHLQGHEGYKVELVCPICGSFFQRKGNLKIHLLSHAGAKTFACSQCDKRFTMGNRLFAHEIAVHGPKTYECELCHKTFPNVHRLKRHTLTHTGEKPFKCCFCTYASNTQGNLLKHVRSIHGKIHFTYKDILKESGKIQDISVPPQLVMELTDKGKEVAENHLKFLEQKGLFSSTLEKLQNDVYHKRETKIAIFAEKQNKIKERIRKQASKANQIWKMKKKKLQKEVKKPGISNNPNSLNFTIVGNDLILPTLDEGSCLLQPNSNKDCLLLLPTTSMIHVTWNDNSNVKKAPRKKKNSKNNYKEKIVNENVTFNPIKFPARGNFRSCENTSQKNQYAFSSKVPLINVRTDLQGSDKMLVNSSDNQLHCVDSVNALVDLEGIDTQNTIVITSDNITDFDRDKLDLYDQFMPINDEETHLMDSFHTITSKDCNNGSNYKGHFIKITEKAEEVRKANKKELQSPLSKLKNVVNLLEENCGERFVITKLGNTNNCPSSNVNTKEDQPSAQPLNRSKSFTPRLKNYKLSKSFKKSSNSSHLNKHQTNMRYIKEQLEDASHITLENPKIRSSKKLSNKRTHFYINNINNASTVNIKVPNSQLIPYQPTVTNWKTKSSKSGQNSSPHKSSIPVIDILLDSSTNSTTANKSIKDFNFITEDVAITSIAEIENTDSEVVLYVDS